MLSDRRHAVYKSLETDAEFRERGGSHGRRFLVVTTTVTRTNYYGLKYKEDVQESVHLSDLAGDRLDSAAWDAFQMQRRIIERTTP